MATAETRAEIWREHPRGGYPDPRIFLGYPGIEQIRAFFRGLAPKPPIHHLTGLVPTEVGPGTATFTMPATGWLLSTPGWVQLGTLAMLADGPLPLAVQTSLPPATPYATSELSLSFLRPVNDQSGTLVARGRLIHAGRSLALSEVHIVDGRGKLVSHGTSRCFISPALMPPPEEPPALEPIQEQTYETPDPYLRPPEGEVIPQDVWNRSSGLEILRGCMAGDLPAPPIHHLTGLRPVEADEGTATFALPATEWLCSPLAKLEGGTIAMLAETALIAAVQTTVPPATAFAPVDLKVNFLRPVAPDGEDVLGRATVIHRGKTLAVSNAELVGSDGKLVAVATGTTMILPGRPWRSGQPVVPADESAG